MMRRLQSKVDVLSFYRILKEFKKEYPRNLINFDYDGTITVYGRKEAKNTRIIETIAKKVKNLT